ncbi:MAG: phosphoribosylamine--glycine ligase [Chloroflexi bacterium]|nr:phosphoribosylamine--glycine ligase [Chloroflexota bacterium]
MRVLVVGSGAREHSLLWKLAQSPRNPELFAAPGNAGTAELATNLEISAEDVDGILAAAVSNGIDLTVVGPEGPLALGIVDRFRAEGLRVFGATQAASRIEWSKAFSKQVMRTAGVPTADFKVLSDFESASSYVLEHGAPVVIKADGLAAGKGVVVAQSLDEAQAALTEMMLDRKFGDAGNDVLIEDCLTGQELSVFCFTDGVSVSPLIAACDYKRIYDGDKGPNTGGMGGYSPPPRWDEAMERTIRETCIAPVVAQMAQDGAPYTGALYGGVMLTDDGPQVIEFNARFGDPECQLIMPRLENDLLDVIDAVIDGKVDSLNLHWSEDSTVGVVLASGGYPASFATGKPISGAGDLPEGTVAFHAGTTIANGALVTSGGRVLTAVGRAPTMREARALAYQAVSRITFDGVVTRSDIAGFAD